MEHPSLLIVIVNWRTPQLTVDCLVSLQSEVERLDSCLVCVVDNGSDDGSAALITKAIQRNCWSPWVTLIKESENRGFAAGNNVALRAFEVPESEFDYVLLLNPDTVARPGAIQAMLSFMESNPNAGIVGGLSEDEDGSPQSCFFRFPNLTSEFARSLKLGLFGRLVKDRLMVIEPQVEPYQVDWVSGACMMIRKQVIAEIGFLDESYFMYFEETDFSRRSAEIGWECWHIPSSKIVHLVGQSSGVTKRTMEMPRRPAYWFESRTRYFVRNHGKGYAVLADLLVILGTLVSKCKALVTKQPSGDPPYYLRDLISHSALFKRNLA